MTGQKLPSYFRDPSGFLFSHDGKLYRQVNPAYKEHYNHLINSGLYDALVKAELLISHQEVTIDCPGAENRYRVIIPEMIPFISYPYEWSFSQLKDAALSTLEIQKIALNCGMSLRDASAYNIQFRKGKSILIDTLSFEKYPEGKPWVAYRQFCQHFLAPLSLMSYRDVRLNQLFRIHIDGIPLDLTSSLLPFQTRFKFPLLSHIHLHATFQKQYSAIKFKPQNHKMNRIALLGLIDNLESAIRKLTWEP